MWKITVLLMCLVLSGVFSASETALTSLSKIRLRKLVEDDVKGAKRVENLHNNPNKMLTTILIGNNLVNIGASSLMTSIAIDLWGNTGVGIATGVMTLLILIFAEITPKSLATMHSETISLKLGGFVHLVSILVAPIRVILTKITNFLVETLGGDVDNNQPFITEDEIKTIVSVSHKEGVLEGEERDMIYNVFEFDDLKARDVMIPRTEIVTLDVDMSYDEIIKIINDQQFSRIPVYADTTDNIIGVLYTKDLLFLQINKESLFDLRKYIRKPYFTYEYKPINELFNEMRSLRTHIVIVLDEYGGTEGIVTIEDLIEEIVGDIEDEYDKDIQNVELIKDNEYLVSGSLELDDVNKLLGTNVASDDFDTIAGLVIDIIDRIPEAGEVIEYEGFTFIVESIDRNRIEKIRIKI